MKPLILVFLVSIFSLNAQEQKKSDIDFCKAMVDRDGHQYRLGLSQFVVGDEPENGKTLFNYKSNFNKPITHIYTFGKLPTGKLWFGCTYYPSDSSTPFTEYVPVPKVPVRCKAVMISDEPNQIQSLRCDWDKDNSKTTPESR